MKLIKTINILLILALFAGCNDDYLERFPQTSITEKNFFSNVEDLKTYSYQFYDYINPTYWDRPSDNTTIHKGSIRTLMLGSVNADNIGGWSWGQLRTINYFLDNYKQAEGFTEEIEKYGAMGRFARARFYIGKVKTYSDVPWYSHVINTDDEEQLYKARDTREMVVDSLIADLEFATQHLTEESSKVMLSKWAAYTELARFCLYEGTYRKYHTGESDLHVTKGAEYFLNKAADAAQAVMASGSFSLSTEGGLGEAYGNLFNGGTPLHSNPEIIMFKEYEDDKKEHGAELVLDFENGISRSMADSYLYTDGSFVPKAVTDTMQIQNVFTDRDPRMKQSIMSPGYIVPNQNIAYKLPIGKTGGYGQIKYMPKEADTHWDGYMTVHTDLPIYRYAEVLLISAEAKAELGQLTQADLDNTVNLLRDRVGMGHLTMNPAVDPLLESLHPNITSSQKAELLEIRRERRVELFAEGLRYDDMMRWKQGKTFEKPQQGIYIPSTGLLDITGDGVADYFISDDGSNEPADLPAGVTKLISSSDDSPIYLENGKSGHVMFKLERTNIGTFIEPKHYYRPVPSSEILLNSSLEQIFGWN
ncbi:RagB/SusD family nutrient uptake outer membrane protein [Puteibacter caeruleilacunae]|nr:RagB/SusD family nutrient uptake outer membrane protein [Puteibacter caeruleilacunae]